MARILGVGGAVLDIVTTVAAYPSEDAEVRARDQHIARGGNTANTLEVLARMGHRCAWAGTWVDEADGRRIVADLEGLGVTTAPSQYLRAGKSPTSYIFLSQATGSRTIIHHRDLPELTAEHLAAQDLTPYRWVHFEGRPNTEGIGAMMATVRRRNPGAGISLEMEKERDGLEALWSIPDALFFGADFIQGRGYTDPTTFLQALDPARVPGLKVAGWGSEGAVALDNAGRLHCEPAWVPERVVDTIGAGDTFNAGLIHGLLQGWSVPKILQAAVALAGKKCGQPGFSGLGEVLTP